MTVWDHLPNELRLQILGYLAHEDGDRASYGSVCRQWLQIMEPYIFEDITFYITNDSVLSGSHTPQKLAAALRGPRLRYLKTLRLVVDIDLFTFTSISHAHSQRMQLGAAFVEVVDGFVDVLRDWKEDACFELQVYDVADCGHHLLEYGSVLSSNDNQRTIQCVAALRTMIHMEGSAQCHNMDSFRNLSGVGHPRLSNMLLWNMSSNMKELSYGSKGTYDTFLEDINPEVYPPGLISLETRNASIHRDWQAAVLAPMLERLHLGNEDVRYEYFTGFCQGHAHGNVPPLSWPKLKYVSWGRLPPTYMPNEMLLHMAHAAGRMPMLKSVDLWGDERNTMHPNLEEDEITPLDAHFQCTIDEKFVTAVFKTTGESQLDDSVRDAWRAMAEQRSRQLHFEVEQVDVLNYTQPFTSPAVEDFFDRHIFVDSDSLYYSWKDIHFADRLLRLRGIELEPVRKRHMYTCLDYDEIEYVSSHDDTWVRYLRIPDRGRQSIPETI